MKKGFILLNKFKKGKFFYILSLAMVFFFLSPILLNAEFFQSKQIIESIDKKTPKSLNIIASHPIWEDILSFSDDGKYVKRSSREDRAEVLLFEPQNKLILKWAEYGEELFLYDSSLMRYVYHIDKEKQLEGLYQDIPGIKGTGEILDVTKHSVLLKDKNGLKRFFKKEGKWELVQESNVSYTTPKKIAILYISTGKYIVFWENFYKSMEKYFLPKHNKTYFLFTDHDDLKVGENVVKIHQDQLPWPYVTMKRYHFFDAIKEKLKEFDYIYFLNGDAKPVRPINEEIFPTEEQEIMVTMHSWFYLENKNDYPYDRNSKSKSYIPYDEGKFYVTGAFNGGTSQGFLKMTSIIKEWTDTDIKNDVIPLWHDESMINKYLFTYFNQQNPLILFPEYVITEPNVYEALNEFPNFKMVLVDKNKEGGRDFLRGVTP